MRQASNTDTCWAVVTGASSGLGLAFARLLAQRGYALLLMARREAPMHALAGSIRAVHPGLQVRVHAQDLSRPGAASELMTAMTALGITPTVLINNAGRGLAGPLLEQSAAALRAMIELNVLSLMELSQEAGRLMARQGEGYILQVASMASLGPTPGLAAYGASKAFVRSFGEALHAELAPAVRVTTLIPGLMDTGFGDAAGGYEAPRWARATVITPEAAAEIGLTALFAGRSSVVSGRLNRLMAWLSPFTSRAGQARMLARDMRR
ncbi:SDR family NAD(P)-dependent oxidoreductase [Luteimonas sp BLCC-B24]|uniref:SDR family NAD(P)-dependent oxidoreductase n=1 Tax=Luteimonas sp. BLCC-B24 TaxID=3025317 RepID=UPI00234D4963|nr:SDR family NAD(P)-dependent oxidoreductase [Luteimonas sp. BLCC-B24]MDC7806738.1 SDR family NAD(P)-dependent oxidoreductase [Luteimonas sp. BLCC-B24]